MLANATWNITWGDGLGTFNFTSGSDNQVPAWQSHTYLSHDSCVYRVTLTVKNPGSCALTGALVETKSALLAGRDWDLDGNGKLVVADVVSGRTDTIYVCEGYQTNVQVRDISTWDCQPGSFPNPPGEANSGARTIQWVYGGLVPNGLFGAGLNTITGNVKVGALGNAIKNGVGIIGDTTVTNVIGKLSAVMTIPATCVRNEMFYVYFKDWNKCNPFAGTEYNNSNYINTQIIIKVIASPAPPTVANIDICEGGSIADRTFHVSSSPVGILSWYDQDPVLFPAAPVLGTGINFAAAAIPAGTNKNYWVVDGGNVYGGVTCVGKPKKVTIWIRNGITGNTISADQTICANDSPVGLTGLVPAGGNGTYAYQWRISTTGAGGTYTDIPLATGQNYSPGVLTVNTWYRRVATSVNCIDNGNVVAITVNPILNASVSIAAVPSGAICAGTSVTFTATPTNGGTTPTYQWKKGGVAIGGETNSTYTTTTLNNGNVITVTMTSNATPCLAGSPATSSGITMTVNANPSITTQPAATAICSGQTTTISITASGPGLTYKWQRKTTAAGAYANLTAALDGSIYSNFTTATMKITGATTARNGYYYRCVLTTTGGCILNSNDALLTVNANPSITAQPANKSVCATGNTSFSITASGPGIAYQWQEDSGSGFSNLSNGGVYGGVTTNTLTLTGAGLGMNGYKYQCVLTTTGGCTLTSNAGTLTVNANPSITAQPANKTICANASTTFSITASGPAISYQWQEDSGSGFGNLSNGGVYGGVTTNTLTLTGAGLAMNGYKYQCVLTTTGGCTLTSNSGTLTVNANPSITVQPANKSVCATGNTTFNITASGPGIAYQWQEDSGSGFGNLSNGGVYGGVTTNSLTLTGAGLGMSGYKYQCVLTTTGACTLTSNTGILTVNANPSITIQPANKTICANDNTTFSLTASGPGISYQWQEDDGGGYLNLSNTGIYSNVTTSTLTLTGAGWGLTGYHYRCVLTTTGSCTLNSNGVQLTIRGPVVTINQGATAGVCLNNSLQLNTTETFTGGVFASRQWTGTYDNDGAGPNPPVALTLANLNALLTNGLGVSRRTANNPIFNTTGTGLGTGIYNLTVTVVDNNGCSSTAQIQINVSQVTASITPAPGVACYGVNLPLNGNPSGGTGVYPTHLWTEDPGNPKLTTVLSSYTSQTPTFNSDVTGIYHFTYHVEDQNLCGVTTPTYTVTVNPLPTAIAQTPIVCSNAAEGNTATVDLTANNAAIDGGNGYTITWYSNALLTTAIATPTSYLVTSGVAVYAKVVNGTCQNSASVTYTVSPKPTAIAQTPTVCSNGVEGNTATVDLTANNSAIDGAHGYTITWYSNALLTAAIATPASYLVTSGVAVYAKVVNGTCQNSASVTYTVSPKPTAIAQTPTVCSNAAEGNTATVDLTSNNSAIDGAHGYTITWYSNALLTAAIATPASYLVTSGVAVYAKVVNGSCQNSASVTYTVSPKPTAIAQTPTVCSNAAEGNTATVDLTSNNSAIDGAHGYTITWYSNALLTTAIATPTSYLVTSGVAVYAKVVNGSCQNSASVTYTVSPKPTAIAQTPAVCSDAAEGNTATVNLTTNNNAIDGPYTYTITWYSDALLTTAIATPASYVVTNGVAVYAKVVNGSCQNSTSVTYTVSPKPTAIAQTPTVCSNAAEGNTATVDLTSNNSAIDGAHGYTITWYSNALLTAAIATPASYLVTSGVAVYAKVVNGSCQNSTSVTYTVSPKPTAIAQTPTVCSNAAEGNTATVDLTANNSAIDGAHGYTITWYSNALLTTAIATPTSYLVTSGVAVYAKVVNGTCQNSASVTYTVSPKPTAIAQTPAVCSDAAEGNTATVNLTTNNNAIDGPYTYTITWYSDALLTTAIATPASYVVTNGVAVYAKVVNGSCQNSTSVTYTVSPKPTAIAQTPTVCSNAAEGNTATVDLTANNSAIDGAHGYTITWYSNALLTTAIATPTSYLVTSGVAVYAKVVNGSCQNSASVTYTVSPKPTAIAQTPTVCSDAAEGNTATVNLTTNNNAIDGPYTYTITWYSDALLTTAIATPASYVVTNGVAVYAKVVNGSCQNSAQLHIP